MALTPKKVLSIAQQYTDDSLEGVGAIAGKPCQIQSITEITGGQRITFLWVDNSSVEHTSTMDVMNGEKGDTGETGATGLGIKSVAINAQNHLIITYDDDTTEDAGEIPTGTGAVSSVNGKTGTVVLDADDVGAVAKETGKGLSENDYTDADKAIVDGVTTALNGKADQTEVDDISNVYGAKNLIPYPYLNKSGTEFRGVTYTVNADGSITANGTATGGDSAFFILQRNVDNDFLSRIGQGNFILSGCPAGGSLQTYYLNFNYGDAQSSVGNLGQDTGNGKEIIIDTDITQYNAQISVLIRDGVTVSNLTFYPMLRMASIKDDTFVLYAKTNRELTIDEAEQQAEINDIVNVYGSKNLNSYPYHESTKTQNGVTFTDNGDGTITVNGTATANANFLCHFRTNADLNDLVIPNGTYILTGCPGGGATSSYDLGANRTHNGSAETLGRDIGNGAEIVLDGDDYSADEVNLGIFIEVKSGTTVSNLTFRPMLRLASIEDDTYVPYVPTNAELHKNKVPYEVASGVQGKNLLTTPYWTGAGVKYGITFTINDDGSVTANGTADSDNNVYFNIQVNDLPSSLALEEGQTYTLSGCPTGGNVNTYSMIVRNVNPSIDIATDVGNGVTFKYNNTSTSTPQDKPTIAIRIIKGTTVSNLTFKPMLEIGAIAHAYEPTPSDTNYDSNAVHETITGKKWIDGKPIYRKVIDIGTLPNNAQKSVEHGISNAETTVRLYGIAQKNTGTSIPLPHVAPTENSQCAIYITSTNVVIKSYMDLSDFSGYVIIEYTKTTD